MTEIAPEFDRATSLTADGYATVNRAREFVIREHTWIQFDCARLRGAQGEIQSGIRYLIGYEVPTDIDG